jgi:hypothetical protein
MRTVALRTAVQGTPEPAQRGTSVQALAKETGAVPLEVETLYDREFAVLAATAKVRSFLSVLASRKVRIVLRQRKIALSRIAAV